MVQFPPCGVWSCIVWRGSGDARGCYIAGAIEVDWKIRCPQSKISWEFEIDIQRASRLCEVVTLDYSQFRGKKVTRARYAAAHAVTDEGSRARSDGALVRTACTRIHQKLLAKPITSWRIDKLQSVVRRDQSHSNQSNYTCRGIPDMG